MTTASTRAPASERLARMLCRACYALLLVAAAALAAAASATATTRIPLPPRFPAIIDAPCPGAPNAGGCAYPSPLESGGACEHPNGCVYLNGVTRFAKWHELGHIYDEQVLDDRDRARLARLLGFRDGGPWFRGTGPTVEGARSPSEWFADAYANCGLGIRPARRHHGTVTGEAISSYGYQPKRATYRRICNAIRFTALA